VTAMTRQSSSSSSPDENRRLRSTLKEKKRNIEINDAFEKLQRQLPHVPSSTRLPKIKTLRLALKYIEHLNTILSGHNENKGKSCSIIVSGMYSSNGQSSALCGRSRRQSPAGQYRSEQLHTERARSEECANGNVRVTSSSSPSQGMLSSSDSITRTLSTFNTIDHPAYRIPATAALLFALPAELLLVTTSVAQPLCDLRLFMTAQLSNGGAATREDENSLLLR
ncbi:Helix-loop-helix DNA-binding domain protein, partial [Ostertagia ostertagi]